ncbi:hypothetical protein [Prolixibacter denitrificans]|uniref:Uncharacterized protein n=1 Tax=Prolixibacter denitrificans TaxID=1541063 RepID=A0A2P8CJA8_9BACT|nr:hypothetical protein [Prolixibacter denitrificans]PSK85060.1 hypothetical protein CLV93_1019 [Prolixibacter denitrificans]GET23602.1 hypothetical protein JCM18694_38480 [Prolixibacter denitrificans]
MSVLFNSDRPAAISLIQEHGYEKFANYMVKNKLMTIKRKGEKPVLN